MVLIIKMIDICSICKKPNISMNHLIFKENNAEYLLIIKIKHIPPITLIAFIKLLL